jgi:hypothetical protein
MKITFADDDQAAAAQPEARDETITIRLGSGDRFRFEDEAGVELCMIEVGLADDPQALAVTTYGPAGKMLGHTTLFK